MANPSLSGIFERLQTAPTYHPLSANTFADWAMEAGDIVTVSRDGTSYASPVNTSTLTWKGSQQVSISSSGNRERTSIAKTSSTKSSSTSANSSVRSNKYWSQYVEDQYLQMKSGIELTASSATMFVQDMYRQMESGLALTSSSAALYVQDMYNQMQSGLVLTSSSAHLYVDNAYLQMTSGLKLTSSSAALYVDNKYTQMSSGLALTSSSAAVYVRDMYSQMQSGLELTSSSAALYVQGMYNQMGSGLALTSSSAALYVQGMYNQMKSGIALTSSSAAVYVRDMYSQMQSGLALTSSSAAVYVLDMYSQMQSGIELTSSTAAMRVSGVVDADGNVTAASIGVAINKNGSNAFIDADHVNVTGNIKLNSVVSVDENGQAIFGRTVAVGTAAGGYTVINTNKVTTGEVQVREGGAFKITTGHGESASAYVVDATTIASMIQTASVDNNTLSLTRFDGTVLDFSKATTLSGTWSGDNTAATATYSLSAKQTNKNAAGQPVETEVATDNASTAAKTTTVEVKQNKLSAYVVLVGASGGKADGAIIARIDNPQYANGWAAAYAKVAEAPQNTSSLEMSVGVPTSTVDATAGSLTYELHSASKNVMVIRKKGGTNDGRVVARYEHNLYSNGVTQGEINGEAAYKAKVKTRFGYASNTYYIEGYENGTSTSIPNSSTTYKLGTSGSTSSTKVQIQNSSGTKISDTPELNVGGLYTTGTNDVAINKGSWSSGIISFMKSTGTSSTKQVKIGGTWSQNGATGTFTVRDYLDVSDTSNGVAVGYTTSVTVSNVDGNNNKVVVKNGSATVAELTHGKYNAGWAAGLSTLSSTATASGTLSYGGTATVTVKYTDAAGTEHTHLSRTYTAPSDRYTTGWGDCYATRVFTASADSKTLSYGESVTVSASLKNSSGTVVSMGSRTYVAPSDRYSTGWDDCYATRVFTASAASKALSYGESVTVSASLKNSSGTVVSMGSRTYVAPSDRYDEGWYDGWNDYYSAKYHAGDWSPATTYGHTWQSTGTGGTTAGKHYVTIPGPYNSSNVYQGWKPLLCVEDEATYLGWSSTSGGGSVNNINLHDPTVTEDGSLVSRMTALSTLSSLINSSVGHRKYIYFTVTASDSNGGSLDKLYYVSIN